MSTRQVVSGGSKLGNARIVRLYVKQVTTILNGYLQKVSPPLAAVWMFLVLRVFRRFCISKVIERPYLGCRKYTDLIFTSLVKREVVYTEKSHTFLCKTTVEGVVKQLTYSCFFLSFNPNLTLLQIFTDSISKYVMLVLCLELMKKTCRKGY